MSALGDHVLNELMRELVVSLLILGNCVIGESVGYHRLNACQGKLNCGIVGGIAHCWNACHGRTHH